MGGSGRPPGPPAPSAPPVPAGPRRPSTGAVGSRALIRIWRIARRAHAALDGEGARLVGGRWNRRGTAVVYTSESLALAALELLVHVTTDTAPADLVAVSAEIPDDVAVERLTPRDLPRDWRSYPAPAALADLGSRWVEERRSAVLAVPSAVIPGETNYLLAPHHPHFARIRIGRPAPFAFDQRLLAGRHHRPA